MTLCKTKRKKSEQNLMKEFFLKEKKFICSRQQLIEINNKAVNAVWFTVKRATI